MLEIRAHDEPSAI